MKPLQAVWVGLAAVVLGAGAAAPSADQASDALAREIFKQLVEINTTDSVGNVTTAAEAMAQRFRAAGFPPADVQVLGDNARKKNLVVRLHGTGKHRPVLLIGHLDVVEAARADWSTDPFQFVEKDGYFYGRGTQDMKDDDAIMVATLLRMKQENYRPDRDIIVALTADEEGGCCNGVDWLLKNHRDLVDAAFAINTDGYSVESEHGVPQAFRLDASQKVYADYQLTVTNKGGHSSEPRPDNAIYELAQALLRVQQYQFPFELNTVTRAYFESIAKVATPQRAADIQGILRDPPDEAAVQRLSASVPDNAIMRTNCVATRLEGGHANNALPQRAQANINCRIFPGHSQEEIRQQLIGVIADAHVTVRYVADNGEVRERGSDRKGFPPPPLMPEVVQPLERVTASTWKGLRVIPYMSAGASDSIYTVAAGIPSYGISGVAVDSDDMRMHGQDERLRITSFDTANGFFYRFLRALTSQ
ncbi:MAG: M20/M25/M40 family metallo-hydrolase [Gammaproteobacteria bacterium]|nr:M20/M25/M40 family metallo-hydrolase [Gammaproteobacteria bacterium]